MKKKIIAVLLLVLTVAPMLCGQAYACGLKDHGDKSSQSE